MVYKYNLTLLQVIDLSRCCHVIAMSFGSKCIVRCLICGWKHRFRNINYANIEPSNLLLKRKKILSLLGFQGSVIIIRHEQIKCKIKCITPCKHNLLNYIVFCCTHTAKDTSQKMCVDLLPIILN